MESSSSTSSSRRDGRPWALVGTLVVTLAIAVAVGLASRNIENAVTLMYDLKSERAHAGPPVDVLLLGDSTAVAAVQAREIERALGAEVRVYNFALAATGPSGAEVILRRYLATHPPPRLVLLGFSPWTLLEQRELFEGFVVPSLFGFGDTLRATWRDRRPNDLLRWLGGRWPTFRHREDLRSGTVSLLLQAIPEAEPRMRAWLGFGNDPTAVFAFRWRYMNRSSRNQELRMQLEESRGWHYWRDAAMPDERLPDGFGVPDPAFRPSVREVAALDTVLGTCHEMGSVALALPMPQPVTRVQVMTSRGDRARFKSLWRELARRHPGLQLADPIDLPTQHRWFADNTHLNPAGARRYTQSILPLVRSVYESARTDR